MLGYFDVIFDNKKIKIFCIDLNYISKNFEEILKGKNTVALSLCALFACPFLSVSATSFRKNRRSHNSHVRSSRSYINGAPRRIEITVEQPGGRHLGQEEAPRTKEYYIERTSQVCEAVLSQSRAWRQEFDRKVSALQTFVNGMNLTNKQIEFMRDYYLFINCEVWGVPMEEPDIYPGISDGGFFEKYNRIRDFVRSIYEDPTFDSFPLLKQYLQLKFIELL